MLTSLDCERSHCMIIYFAFSFSLCFAFWFYFFLFFAMADDNSNRSTTRKSLLFSVFFSSHISVRNLTSANKSPDKIWVRDRFREYVSIWLEKNQLFSSAFILSGRFAAGNLHLMPFKVFNCNVFCVIESKNESTTRNLQSKENRSIKLTTIFMQELVVQSRLSHRLMFDTFISRFFIKRHRKNAIATIATIDGERSHLSQIVCQVLKLQFVESILKCCKIVDWGKTFAENEMCTVNWSLSFVTTIDVCVEKEERKITNSYNNHKRRRRSCKKVTIEICPPFTSTRIEKKQ